MARESFFRSDCGFHLHAPRAIKVDRESQLRDAFCIQVLLHKDAGWPANIFFSPQKVPLMGGTYYPLYYQYGFWISVPPTSNFWTQGPGDPETGQHILEHLKQPQEDTETDLLQFSGKGADERHGGFGWGATPTGPRLIL